MSEPIVLYHGDNGAQEFFEDAESRYIVFRFPRRPEIAWQGYPFIARGVLDCERGVHGETAEHVIRRLHERTGTSFTVDASREWRYVKPRHKRMRLVALDPSEGAVSR